MFKCLCPSVRVNLYGFLCLLNASSEGLTIKVEEGHSDLSLADHFYSLWLFFFFLRPDMQYGGWDLNSSLFLFEGRGIPWASAEKRLRMLLSVKLFKKVSPCCSGSSTLGHWPWTLWTPSMHWKNPHWVHEPELHTSDEKDKKKTTWRHQNLTDIAPKI